MKLKTGAYDTLINRDLASDMRDAKARGLICQTEEIDSAESPTMLARYIANAVEEKLKGTDWDDNKLEQLINGLIQAVRREGDEGQLLTSVKEKLTAVLSASQQAQLRLTRQQLVRPQSGFSVSSLFTGGQSILSLHEEIKRDIASADEICLLISFLKMSGVRTLMDDLRRFCAKEGHRLRLITTTYCGITEGKAVEQIAQLPNTEVRISYQSAIERLHAKSYIFLRYTGLSTAYIGSSNLSHSAHTDGLEWNIRVTNMENPHIIKTAVATFDTYWNSSSFEPFDIQRFNEVMAAERRPRSKTTPLYPRYKLQPFQKAILEKIKVERDVFGIHRNLIVAATGTGKTVISAFDYRAFANSHPSHRLLFVAHREEILKQAIVTYRAVLEDYNFGDLLVGAHQPRQTDHLFVSVQMLQSRQEDFRQLGATHFDYIVIDEAHHIEADSYQRVVQFFDPQILLGLTATPERMDGKSLLPDFDNKISAEIRLPQALNEGLLTPFQYLCITDPTDISNNELWEGGKYVTSRLAQRLCNEDRATLIIAKLREYLNDETQCKALCFCCNKQHAKFMADAFQKHGLAADFLTSDSDKAHRNEVNQRLRSGQINYLFVVDIFNEGVDIPEVDTVLFLRPTESLTIFLQQLGRGLRLCVGKDYLTVFDFVAQVHRNYDFSSRFRALLTRQDVNVADQISMGFTRLPQGCLIYMEEQAQRVVLDNIKGAIYNVARLRRELAQYTTTPTLNDFLEANGQDLRLIYRGQNCWTKLKKAAGKCPNYADDILTRHYEKGMGQFTHINSLAYMRFILRFLDNACTLPTQPTAADKAFAVMLYYALYQNKITADDVPFSTIDEALHALHRYPLFVEEIREIIAYLQQHLSTATVPVGEGMPEALEVHGCYTREEVFAIFGRQTPEQKMQGAASGVFWIDERNAELLFVTLNKSDRDFSPSTQYDDYVISEQKFHWQSQNTDCHARSGRRFVEQKTNGKKFLLFVRENKKDGYGNTCPFYCFGLVDYVASRGDFPMSIEWQLHSPAMPQFVKAI